MEKIKNFSLSKLFSNRRFTAVFSVVVAFIAWLAISVNQTETRTSTFANITVNLGIEDSFAGNMGLEVVSDDYIKTVNVTVNGPNYIVSSIKPSDILINADLSDVTAPGEYNIPLVAQSSSGVSGFSFVEISPKSIKLVFDYVDTKEFDVIAKADNVVAADGLYKDTPMLNYVGDSKKLAITGPRSKMNLIDRVEVIVNEKDKISASQTYDADIVLYDKDLNVIDNSYFTLPTETLKVTVPIYKEKTVAVIPVFSGESYVGEGLSMIESISPSKVTVQGAPDVIDALESVELTAVDIASVKSGKVIEVGLNLPGGIKEVNSVTTVKITIKK
ncbi:MAG: CdaR family protein [Acutalibacteraceae bacterium]|nr:CdaR family protein [Acutalibacteraceae bacterium]